MPLTPPTLTRLDPGAPLVWRDASTLQLGDDGTLCVAADEAWVEPLLSRLRLGFRRSAYDVIAHTLGAPRDAARRLLALIEPTLLDDPAPPRDARTFDLGLSDERTERRLREALADEGVRLRPADDARAVAIVLVPGAAAAVSFGSFLRDDAAHLPVCFEPGRVTVGPLVVPGTTPCLACRDAEDTARDPAWPLVHAQLIARDPGPVGVAHVSAAGMHAARMLARTETTTGTVVRVSADGTRAWRSVSFHAGCLCRVPSFPSRPGTATVPVPRALRSAPTRARGYARPA
jgi:hypothetical protein